MWKNHFIAILCGTDPAFAMNLWDKLVRQIIITFNLLGPARLNLKLSAHTQIYGAFVFSCNPLAPPGTKAMVHEKPDICGTRYPHAVEAWYVVPVIHQYQCYCTWFSKTQAERITDTLAWLPSQVVMPVPASTECAIAAAHNLTSALLHPSLSSPITPINADHHVSLHQLATIFTDTGDATIFPPPDFPPLPP